MSPDIKDNQPLEGEHLEQARREAAKNFVWRLLGVGYVVREEIPRYVNTSEATEEVVRLFPDVNYFVLSDLESCRSTPSDRIRNIEKLDKISPPQTWLTPYQRKVIAGKELELGKAELKVLRLGLKEIVRELRGIFGQTE